MTVPRPDPALVVLIGAAGPGGCRGAARFAAEQLVGSDTWRPVAGNGAAELQAWTDAFAVADGGRPPARGAVRPSGGGGRTSAGWPRPDTESAPDEPRSVTVTSHPRYRMPTWAWLGLLVVNVALIVVLLVLNVPTTPRSGQTIVTVVHTVTASATPSS